MATSCPVPSAIEPDALADLIADARLISLPRQSTEDPVVTALPGPAVVIPPASVSLVEGYADYGV
jgi:hypothetical protein